MRKNRKILNRILGAVLIAMFCLLVICRKWDYLLFKEDFAAGRNLPGSVYGFEYYLWIYRDVFAWTIWIYGNRGLCDGIVLPVAIG